MDTKIELNKDRADAARYYQLFRDKTGEFKDGEKILLLHIGNFDVLDRFIKSNEKCEYTIIDQFLNGPWFELSWPNAKVVGTSEDESIVKALMVMKKFDKIIMNPPYSRNLHLKILEEAIKHLDENGTCVNLSPVRWLQDPLAKYKKNSDYLKFEDSIVKHIKKLDIIDTAKSCELFTAGLNVQLGMYSITKKKTNGITNDNIIIDKVLPQFINNSLKGHIVIKEPQKYSCVVQLIAGGKEGWTEKTSHWMMTKEKAYYDNGKNCKGQTYKEYRDKIIWGNLKPKSEVTLIEFNTPEERENFYNSCETDFYRYLFKIMLVDVNVHEQFLPWMGDAINPRTKKKGYLSEWTDEDFYTYFNITLEEQKLIESTMEKYK